MKHKITLLSTLIVFCFLQQINSQVIINDNTTFNTRNQMFLSNELFESGEPFAESLGYNLDNLDPLVLNQPDSIAYTTGIENYEYSRYLLNTVNGRSGIGLHMMWSPVITANAAAQGGDFDGSFTGGVPNGFKEDDMLMKTIREFGLNANFTPFQHPFPIYAAFETGNTNLPQTVTADFLTNFASTHWDRSLMTKTLNIGAMAQTMWKQYFWAQDMLSSFHDGAENDVIPTGSNSPDLPNSPNLDPNNNIFYGGNNIDGFIGQVLTAEAINMTKFTLTQLAYDGTSLGAINPATYNPANGIKYFPTKIDITENTVLAGLPQKLNTLTIVDTNSHLFDQLSFLLATSNFRNMMNATDNSNTAHLAYHEVFDGFPFPADMATTGSPGPYDLMSGAGKVTFLNIMAMHFNNTEGTFVDISSLGDGNGQVIRGNTISAEVAGYIIVALAKFSTEYAGTPLQTGADNALAAQANFIIANFKDPNGGYFNSFTIGTGASSATKTMAANAAIIRGLYAAYTATNNTTFLTEANTAYNYLINNFYSPSLKAFRTKIGNEIAIYNPWNMALLSGALREAKLVGNQADAAVIYTRVFKKVYNKMIISEAEVTGETGGDSDGDGVPYIVGGTKPFVFAAQGTLSSVTLSISDFDIDKLQLSIYPNPTNDHVFIKLNLKNKTNVGITITDMVGRIVAYKKENLSFGLNTISVPILSLSTGSYLVRISSDIDTVAVGKLLVN